MNNPIIMEMLANEKMNSLRREGLYSQELRRAGLVSRIDFTWITGLLSRVSHAASGALFPRVFRAGASKP